MFSLTAFLKKTGNKNKPAILNSQSCYVTPKYTMAEQPDFFIPWATDLTKM